MNPSSWFDADGDRSFQVLWEEGDRVFYRGRRRGADGDRDEAGRLFGLALDDARRLNLPEMQQIEEIMRQAGIKIPSPAEAGVHLSAAEAADR